MITRMQPIRIGSRDSPKKNIPNNKVPHAPIPVQTA